MSRTSPRRRVDNSEGQRRSARPAAGQDGRIHRGRQRRWPGATHAAADSLVGTLVAHYEIEAELGRGGAGTVYRAYDRELDRRVALKFVRAHAGQKRLGQFLKEVHALSNLNDPNIVTIHAFEKYDDGRFIVMEFVEGVTLRALSDPGATPPITTEEIVRVGLQVAEALRVAHAAGIVHGDIKPENVMVRRHDRLVKLLDFGLARLVGGRSPSPPPDAAGSAGDVGDDRQRTTESSSASGWYGTLRYMSPEQIQRRKLTSATDIFSLGIVLYEMLAGRHPFDRRDELGAAAHIIETEPVPPQSLNQEVPYDLGTLVLSMLATNPASRPDAQTVIDRLSQIPVKREAVRRGRPHIVGRREQLRWALDRVNPLRGGTLLCVSGEAGAGKTTFVEEFLDRVELPRDGESHAAGYLTLRGRCEKLLAGAEAYLPVLEVLHTLLREDGQVPVANLLREHAPGWYAQLSGGAPDAASGARTASPEGMNREFVSFLSALCGQRPILLFLDDVQWADVSTVYLLDYLAARRDRLRLVTIVTLRPEALDESHPFLQLRRRLAAKEMYDELALDLLSQDDVRQYVDLEFPKHQFPIEFVRRIHNRTEGNPLFMVDLLRDLRARGVIAEREGRWTLESVSDIELPKRVENLIEQKISALQEPDRVLLTWAAVQGYEFDSAVLAQASGASAGDIEVRLDVLNRKHALVRGVATEDLPNGTLTLKYRFTHVLYQNALDEQLLRTPSRRAEFNLAVAEALIAIYGGHRRVVASLLARLFAAARHFDQAADYFHVAAQNAAQVSAHHEAEALLRRGLEFLHRLPLSSQRQERELAMQLDLGASLMAMKGFGAEGVYEAYERARQLCDKLGDPQDQMPMVLRGLWGYHVVRAEYETARKLAHSLYDLAERARNHALLVEGHHALAFTLCHMGELPKAVEHRRKALALYAERPGVDYGFPFALDPGVGCRIEYAMDLWMLGYPDQAQSEASSSRDLAKQLGHPYSLGFALMFSAVIHELCGDLEAMLEFAEDGFKLATEHGLREVLGWSQLRKGWALAMLGSYDAGINLQLSILKHQRELGSEVARPHFMAALAQSMLEARRPDAALRVVEEGLETTIKTGARYYHAELLRLLGECQLALGRPGTGVEDLFRQAAEIAKAQHARSFELRSAISLARLLATSARSDDARATLAPVYAWFTEGFDTEDLREAKELLVALK